VQYFSAPLGETVPCPVSGYSNICASGACFNNAIDDRGYCVEAPKSYPSFPMTCESSSDCVGFNSAHQQFFGQCECGFNPEGQKYCQPFSGDLPGLTYIAQIKPIMTSSAMNLCQTTRRYYSDCLDMAASSLGINSDLYFSAQLNFTNYAQYIGNDACVKSIITASYWNRLPPTPPGPEPPHNHTSSAGYLVAGVAFLIIFN